MFVSPVLSNAPRNGETKGKGLPIHVLTYVPDTLEGLIEHSSDALVVRDEVVELVVTGVVSERSRDVPGPFLYARSMRT